MLTLVRAAGSLVVLAVLLAGLPLLLWWGTAAVGPDGVRALGNLLSTQDSGQVFLLALAVAGWIGWALFALSVLLEIPAQLRGRTAPQVRLLVGQRAAATLVGAVLLALPTGTALAASATPAQASPTVAAASVLSGSPATDGTHDATPAAQSAKTITHTVVDTRPAESLWSIAEQRLGDGNRWEEIADLNAEHTMANGSVFRADGPIQPGWTLRLPADASPARAATTADPTTVPDQAEDEGGLSTQEHRTRPAGGGKVYTVAPGDNLSKIAGKELGDDNAYPAIFELNKGEPQPGGGTFTNPDLLYPGQKLDLPAQAEAPAADRDTVDRGPDEAAEPDTEPPAAQPEKSPPPGNDEAAPPPAPAQTPPVSEKPPASPEAETPQPEVPDAADPGGAAPTKPDTEATPSTKPTTQQPKKSPPPAPPAQGAQESPAPAPTTQAPQHTDTASDSDGVHQVALAAGIGALLAASLAGTLAVKRILQQRRRRAGETIAIDADPTPLEQVLNTQGGPTGVALLDTALRTLAGSAQAEDRELPVLRGARVSDRTIELILDEPADPIAPFLQGTGTGRWALDAKATLLDLDNAADDAPAAPYPGLVTLGTTENGDLLLADLLHTGALLLDGTADDVLAVGRAMALEAGTCGWTDHTEIMTVGLGTRLATLLPRGRVRPLPHVSAVVADLGALLLEVHQQTDTADMPEPLPWILVCAGDVDAEQAWQLADAVSAARDLPIAIVLPANEATRAAFPAAESIPTAPGTPVALPQLGQEPVQLQRLTDEQYRQYLHALQVAEAPAEPATGTWQLAEAHEQTAAAPRPEPDPLLRIRTSDSEADSDPGAPFPALLASVGAAGAMSKEDAPAAKDAPEGEAVPGGASTGAAARSGDGGPATTSDEPAVEAGGEPPSAPVLAVLGPR
ncbi:LysM peptidoglycan-binding domain-containing protein, partial [Streptomyces rubiginosohelvolus]|uniref:LysM peptidoglycan-binding domain-containing protein n=1 Tax=Streptomyces rubiginosohelvolus TaxID=67362 RepID=UPI0035D95140